jgi:glyoxylase-like metal-dependent hydrolase (beta-lactamase superfamily II)
VASAITLLATGSRAQAQVPPTVQFDRIEFSTDRLAEQFYTLTGSRDVDPGHPDGAGGRIGVLIGPDGVFMVDASYAPVTDKVIAAIRRLSSAPIRFLVNTHFHPDHSGGNAHIAATGALVLAQEDVHAELVLAPDLPGFGDKVPEQLPIVTYRPGMPVTVRLNGETIDLIPVRAAHTAGDTMVRFEKADVIMVGDFYRSFGYPFIDTVDGGTLHGLVAAIETAAQLAGRDTKIVPGHGAIGRRTDLIAQRDLILAVTEKVKLLRDRGKTEDEVVEAHPTGRFDAFVPGGLSLTGVGPDGITVETSADRFVRSIYQQLSPAAK